jgi:integrase
MAKKSKKYPGVYSVKGKRGVSYGIDYIHPQTNQRIKKILKNVSSVEKAAEIRAIEIADAKRGVLNAAYNIKENKTRPVLFEDMVKAYLKWSRENKDSWKTDEHRAKPLQKAFKGKLMSDLNPFMVEKYKMTRIKTVQKSTVNKELIFASQVFQKAVEWGKFEGVNPFLNRFKLKKGRKPGALTPEQVEAIIAEVDHPVKRDMIGFAYHQGWRISEIRKLKWTDVDLERGLAWIVDPKNGESVQIPLGNEALEIISRQESRGDHVFCHLNGNPYKTNLQDVFRNASQRAGVELPPRKKWHILRRTWASEFLSAGGHVEDLRVQGNWRDTSMPLYYAEAQGVEARKGVLDRMPKLNGRNKEEIEKVVSLNERIS